MKLICANGFNINFGDVIPDNFPNAEVVRETERRRVIFTRFKDKPVVIKFYYKRSVWDFLKRIFRKSYGQREWSKANFVRSKNISTFNPLGYGEYPFWCLDELDSVFVYERIEAETLKDVVSNIRTFSEKKKLIQSVAYLLAYIHSSGFIHTDLHSGNILIRREGEEFKCYIVDLMSFAYHGAVSDRESINNLASLGSDFYLITSRADKIRFLKSYLTSRSEFQGRFVNELRKDRLLLWSHWLGITIKNHIEKIMKTKEKRLFGDGKYFDSVKLPRHWRGYVFLRAKHPQKHSPASFLQFSCKDWEELLKDPEEFVATLKSHGRVYKESRSTLVCAGKVNIAGKDIRIVTKRYRAKKRFPYLRYMLRYSRAIRSWQMSWACWFREIPVALPLVALDKRIGPFWICSLTITEQITNSVNLTLFVKDWLDKIPQEKFFVLKYKLINDLAYWVKCFYLCGIVHRDLKPSNILIKFSDGGSLDNFDLIFIDMEALRKTRNYKDDRFTVRMLTRFSFTADMSPKITLTDRVRFLKRYVSAIEPMETDWKELWRKIEYTRNTKYKGHRAG